MTRDAIDALMGMQAVVNPGETVFIKPNCVTFPWAQHNNCFHFGECTKLDIIIADTEECLKAGAAEVIIGEVSHLPTFEWQYIDRHGRVLFPGFVNQLLYQFHLKIAERIIHNIHGRPGFLPSQESQVEAIGNQ